VANVQLWLGCALSYHVAFGIDVASGTNGCIWLNIFIYLYMYFWLETSHFGVDPRSLDAAEAERLVEGIGHNQCR
jgi:hypothetical protein